jgi:hypothetical protein
MSSIFEGITFHRRWRILVDLTVECERKVWYMLHSVSVLHGSPTLRPKSKVTCIYQPIDKRWQFLCLNSVPCAKWSRETNPSWPRSAVVLADQRHNGGAGLLLPQSNKGDHDVEGQNCIPAPDSDNIWTVIGGQQGAI